MSDNFNGEMLVLARQLRKKSQGDVVAALKGRITQGTLSKIEHGLAQPDDDLRSALAGALRVRQTFFENPTYVRSMPVSYHRARQKLPAKDEAAIHSQSEVFRINVRKLLDSVELDHRLPAIPVLDPAVMGGAEKCAEALRQHWGLPRGPIKSVTRSIEDSGAIVIQFNFATKFMDGFCQRATDAFPAVVYINSEQPNDRYRFSLSHELGHLTMHVVPHQNQEIEANRFASAFLMPHADIKPHLNNLSIHKLQELKMYWGVSMQALIYRAWQLGCISDRSKKYYFIEMSKRGWREVEPIETSFSEKATALRDVLKLHMDELGYSLSELSNIFGINEDEIEETFPVGRAKPKLRLVIG